MRCSLVLDGIQRLCRSWSGCFDRIFYLRWTSGPNYERVFLCIDDGEPDMHDLATMSFGQARIFAKAYSIAKQLPLPTPPTT
jgi:hypothetical protein